MIAVLPADGIAKAVAEPPAGCHLFPPASLCQTTPLLVRMHGVSRNAEEHLSNFAPLAAAHGVAMLAPVFAPAPLPPLRLELVQGAGHRFGKMAAHGAVTRACSFLFGSEQHA